MARKANVEVRVKGHGAGADNELGATIAQEDLSTVMNTVAEFPIADKDAFLVVASLEGGTGSGGAPVIAREVNRLYEKPVYGLGVLPSRDEGGIYQLNAARSFLTFIREVDNLILFDNDAWRRPGGGSLEASYDYFNGQIAKRIGLLMTAGMGQKATPEMVVDASEIINTLSTGGVSTIGYATSDLARARRGLLSQLSGPGEFEASDVISQIVSTVRLAALGRLTLPCEIDSAQRALVITAGPPEHLSRQGVERALSWLEDATGTREVRGGDYPIPGEDKIGALVLLSGVTDVPRLDELQRIAIEMQQTVADIEAASEAALRELTWSGGEQLEPLFE